MDELVEHFVKGFPGQHKNRLQWWDDFGTHVYCSCGKKFHMSWEEIKGEVSSPKGGVSLNKEKT